MHTGLQGLRLGRPPIPREHGVWMMVYTPLLIPVAGIDPAALLPLILLILAVTGAFLGQNAAGLLIRRRADRGTAFWLGVYTSVLLAGSVPLLWIYRLTDLLWVGVLAAGLFGRQVCVVWPSHRRVDHSRWGEIVAVGTLVLTAPAACVVSRGTVDGLAWSLWAGCLLYFGSSVFYVKMRVSAARVRENVTPHVRWHLGRDLLVYHLALIGILVGVFVTIGGQTAVLIVVAYLPVLFRAFWGWARLSSRIPSLKRIGLSEVGYTLWFAGFSAAVLSAV